MKKKWNWPTQFTCKVTLGSMNLLVGPFLLPLNASLGALLDVFFIRGFPQQQPAEISHHICIKWIQNLLKYHEGVFLVSWPLQHLFWAKKINCSRLKRNYLNIPYMGMKSNFDRKRDVMEHFDYFSWIQRPKIYRNQLQNWRQFLVVYLCN